MRQSATRRRRTLGSTTPAKRTNGTSHTTFDPRHDSYQGFDTRADGPPPAGKPVATGESKPSGADAAKRRRRESPHYQGEIVMAYETLVEGLTYVGGLIVRDRYGNIIDTGGGQAQTGANAAWGPEYDVQPYQAAVGGRRRRRRRLLTASDKADIAFITGTLGKGEMGKAAIASLLSRRC